MSFVGNVNIAAAIAASYRPPNWGLSSTQTYSITCTLPANTPSSANPNQNTTATPGQPTTYFFDATLRVEHVQEAVGTKHPVQVGPAIVDHIYLMPARVTLEVAMSDAMQSFQSGQYSGGTSRSVVAYQTFKQIQAARVPIALNTRLTGYANMWLVDVRGVEDSATSRGFRGTLRFEQIISAQVASATVSSRPATTDTTNEGTKGVQPVPADLMDQIPLSH